MRIRTDTSEPIDKHRTVGGKRMNQIGDVLSLHHVGLFQARNAVFSECERFLFDSAKPPGKPGKIKRVLFARVYENHATASFDLGSDALGKYWNRWGQQGSQPSAIEWINNQGAMSHHFDPRICSMQNSKLNGIGHRPKAGNAWAHRAFPHFCIDRYRPNSLLLRAGGPFPSLGRVPVSPRCIRPGASSAVI
jgi:hypothetical protein